MLALLILLPTFAFVPIYFFVLPVLYIVLRNKIERTEPVLGLNYKAIDKNFLIVLLIIVLSFLNKLYHYFDELPVYSLIPYTSAVILTYFISKNLSKKDLVVIVYIIAIEAVIVIVQFGIGVNSFYPSIKNEVVSPELADLMYYRKPFGLSYNSSIIAYKLFVAYLIMDYLKLKGQFYLIIRLVLIISIYFVFNRTVFLVMIVYFGLSMIRLYGPVIEQLLSYRLYRFQVKYVLLGLVVLVGLTAFILIYQDVLMNQLTKGKGKVVELSGREHIWSEFIEFIKVNWGFGNGSVKYYVDHLDSLAHAHNSYLQVISTNGIFISILYFWLIIRNLNKKNLPFIIVILVYSFFQYGVFWGISLMDIILFKLLFFYNNIEVPRLGNESRVNTVEVN
tara:strand:+ start:26546 stop:27721 length:1176 start_codon:yes stop_codon:yes gene_type:complete